MSNTALKNLRTFQKLCGGNTLDKVYLTTTMWDRVKPEVGERRSDELRTQYWASMITEGAHLARCRKDDDSPKQLVRQIVAREIARELSSIQEDVCELRKKFKDTSAGQQLCAELETLVKEQQERLKMIHEKKAGSDAEKLEELRTAYNERRLQIQDKLCQARELKLSWIRHFFPRR